LQERRPKSLAVAKQEVRRFESGVRGFGWAIPAWQGCIKLPILSLRGTSGGERIEERGETNRNAPPLLHRMEQREKSRSLMRVCLPKFAEIEG
jgi:hypothetical protein